MDERRGVEQQLILDRYRPLAELGEGAFGVVALAWDTRMQRRVAIKRLDLPSEARGRGQHASGLAEARTAAMLNHPNIVTVFDFDTDSDEAFLVMEYVDGASLADVLNEVDGRLEPDEAASVLGDVCEALIFAHDNGVLHLDIKPENVLITRDGRAKVADFGISQLSSLSGHGAAHAGTVGYMPLEQASGGPVSEQTDEWALAALMLKLLTGENPYAAPSREASLAALRNADAPWLVGAADLPAQAREVLASALSVEPHDRFPAVADFADALEPLLGDPQAGRLSLAEIVDELADEEESPSQAPAHLGLWDRSGGKAGRALIGLAAAAEAGWLVWAGLLPLGLDPRGLGAAVWFVALGSFLAPALGIALGLGCLTLGLVTYGAWVPALIVPLAGGLWWWFLARRSGGATVLPLAGPLFGAVRLPFAHPLVCGFSLPPIKAAATALLGGMLAFVASAASAQAPPYAFVRLDYIADIWSRLAYTGVAAMLQSPAAYVALLGWPVAAAVSSVFSARATRGGAAGGAASGAVVLLGAYTLADRVAAATSSADGYVTSEFAVLLVASLILVMFITALGAPVRGEEEEWTLPRRADLEDD